MMFPELLSGMDEATGIVLALLIFAGLWILFMLDATSHERRYRR